MTLFTAWSEIVADWAPRFPSRAPSVAPRARPWAPWSASAGAVCRASSGPRAANSAVGRASTFSTRVGRWDRRPCLRVWGDVPCPIVAAAWWAWRSMTPACARPAAPFPKRAIIAIPSRRPFMSTSCAACAFSRRLWLLPLHRRATPSCRALPVRFEEAAPLKKPSRKAGAEAWQEYKRMSKLHNLSQRFVQSVAPLRQALDEAGGAAKLLVLALDGSFCNRTCFRAARERTELIARARKDARLCFPRPPTFPTLFMLSPPSLPNRSARTSPTPGNRPSSFTEASAASSAIKKR